MDVSAFTQADMDKMESEKAELLDEIRSLRAFIQIHEAEELWEEHGNWERYWCAKCGALYQWNAEMKEPAIEIPPKTRVCKPK